MNPEEFKQHQPPQSPEVAKDIVTEEQVIALLDEREYGDLEAISLFTKYVDQCHADADERAKGVSGSESNRINLETEIKIALLKAKTKRYKSYALDDLYALRENALQNDQTQDLAEQIDSLIAQLELDLE
ncbi:hypothetical protein IT399_02720 [Candidatus Nomurabacteria bacterium]|nr:hypothetical protein [Candidatus Nomurabacteria bacterium]